jgi:anti-sigma B factor antagonist
MGELEASQPRLTHAVVTPGDGSVVVVLDGELDIATAEQLNAEVEDAIRAVRTCLVIDVQQLRFADSSALALWVAWSLQVPKIEIRNPRPTIRRMIEIMGLTKTLNLS